VSEKELGAEALACFETVFVQRGEDGGSRRIPHGPINVRSRASFGAWPGQEKKKKTEVRQGTGGRENAKETLPARRNQVCPIKAGSRWGGTYSEFGGDWAV